MNPILAAALGSIARWALAFVAGFLVKAGIWNATEAETYIAAGALAIIAIVWSVWTKYRDRIKFLTGLAMPAGSTENDVVAKIALGVVTPSVLTPPNTAPGVPTLEDIKPWS